MPRRPPRRFRERGRRQRSPPLPQPTSKTGRRRGTPAISAMSRSMIEPGSRRRRQIRLARVCRFDAGRVSDSAHPNPFGRLNATSARGAAASGSTRENAAVREPREHSRLARRGPAAGRASCAEQRTIAHPAQSLYVRVRRRRSDRRDVATLRTNAPLRPASTARSGRRTPRRPLRRARAPGASARASADERCSRA